MFVPGSSNSLTTVRKKKHIGEPAEGQRIQSEPDVDKMTMF
jgi:hypothetical protein